MVSKWNAVRAEVLLEEEIEAAAHAPESIEELARRKRQRLTEWEQALSIEDVERNANFVPLAGDWRARVARARQRKTGSASGTVEVG